MTLPDLGCHPFPVHSANLLVFIECGVPQTFGGDEVEDPDLGNWTWNPLGAWDGAAPRLVTLRAAQLRGTLGWGPWD